ncbi:MAG: 4Fe-4S binding protein [Candidatus Thermoplasmatota archaeon]
MKASYGYTDGSGGYYIIVDTEQCTACGLCVQACRWGVMEVGEDEHDPLSDRLVAKVSEAHRKKIKYSCAQCKPASKQIIPPCISSCAPKAIEHSW